MSANAKITGRDRFADLGADGRRAPQAWRDHLGSSTGRMS